MFKNLFVSKNIKYDEKPASNLDQPEKLKVVEVVVGMGQCGITAGSRDVLQAILGFAMENGMNNIVVISGGCIGHCECEPIVLVRYSCEPYTVYKNVTPDLASQIMIEHVQKGNILVDHTLALSEAYSANHLLRR